MKVTINKEQCIGAGQCVLSAPEVFDQRDDDGIVILLEANPPAEAAQSVKQAVLLCPALAIAVED